jgi:hypothetical protein
MSIILVVIGIGLVYQFNSQDKELLRKTSVKIEAMSSRGHAMSVLHQKPFWLRIEHDKVVLAGADVRNQDLLDPDGFPELTEDGEFSESNEEIYDTLDPPGEGGIGDLAVSECGIVRTGFDPGSERGQLHHHAHESADGPCR